MADIIIYHNGECSKSKGALEILQEKGVAHEVRYYLMEPLSDAELTSLLNKLKLPPSAIVRKSEPVYKELYEGITLTEPEWKEALLAHPVLMERPIVEKGNIAIVARPPEKILEIL